MNKDKVTKKERKLKTGEKSKVKNVRRRSMTRLVERMRLWRKKFNSKITM